MRCSRKIPLDLIAASWDSGQKQHQHTGSLVTGERWSQVANTFTGKHFVMILNSMPTFLKKDLLELLLGAVERQRKTVNVPAYTTKPTAWSVCLTVQPRSSRLSIPAPTLSLSGFSLQQETVRNLIWTVRSC